jgi:hypothetical protein
MSILDEKNAIKKLGTYPELGRSVFRQGFSAVENFEGEEEEEFDQLRGLSVEENLGIFRDDLFNKVDAVDSDLSIRIGI